jgi:cysteine-rich repeat protein
MISIHRKTAWLGLLAASIASLAAACGDGGTTTATAGTAGTAGAGNTGGTDATGGTSSGAAGTATGGTAGTATGGTGGTGGSSMLAPDGAPCAGDAECSSGFCISQMEFGWPNGYCTGACNQIIPCLDADSICADFGVQICLKACVMDSDCGSGKACVEIDDAGTLACGPFCTSDAECEGYGLCDLATGGCYVPEDCEKAGDEDQNGAADCEDPACAAKCTPMLDMACGKAEPVTLAAGSVTKMGDTSTGSNLFVSSCTGSGANEKIYQITAPADQAGVLKVTLTSALDFGFYVRKECTDAAAELNCTDLVFAGVDEVATLSLAKGESIFVFIDAFTPGDAGAYSLKLDFEAEICGDGKIVGAEQCDDSNMVAGDGCNAMCAAEASAEIEPNNDKLQATPAILAGGAGLYTSKLVPGGTDEDWYLVTIGGGASTITATTLPSGSDICAPDGDIDTQVFIYGAAMAPIAENEDISAENWCSSASASMLADGVYHVQVIHSQYCDPMVAGECLDFDYNLLIQVK